MNTRRFAPHAVVLWNGVAVEILDAGEDERTGETIYKVAFDGDGKPEYARESELSALNPGGERE
jgi:hypothetical protein